MIVKVSLSCNKIKICIYFNEDKKKVGKSSCRTDLNKLGNTSACRKDISEVYTDVNIQGYSK